jgi:hypothetical protein
LFHCRRECNFTSHQLDVTKICNGGYKIFIRTDSFVSNTDPALLAFNDKLAPEDKVAGGTFSAGLAFAVKVASAEGTQPASCPATPAADANEDLMVGAASATTSGEKMGVAELVGYYPG